MIWKYAIRPAQPAAHVFRIFSPKDREGSDRKDDLVLLCDNRFNQLHLAVPQFLPGESVRADLMNGDEEGLGNRPSAYLIDGGLWTACRESRRVIQRKFDSQAWDKARRDRYRNRGRAGIGYPAGANENEMPATGYFAPESGNAESYRIFTVFPHQDLFYLQPYNLETLDWGDINYSIPLGSSVTGYQGLQNIALDFDPAWGRDAEEFLDGRSLGEQTAVERMLDSDHARPRALGKEWPKGLVALALNRMTELPGRERKGARRFHSLPFRFGIPRPHPPLGYYPIADKANVLKEGAWIRNRCYGPEWYRV
ncbi:hypothetical protein VTK56DRAFT_5536 [Thermocarpiscus australiensis]